MKPILSILMLILLMSATAFAQKEKAEKTKTPPKPRTIVSGVISDMTNKEKLPFVNVYFTNTTTGTTSDLYGSFTLETMDQGLTSISFMYLGYDEKTIEIIPGSRQTLNIELTPSGVQMEEVVIKAKRKVKKDTAALRLYRNVVDNKDKNRSTGYDYYSYEEYVKTEFDLYNISEKFKKRKVLKPFDFVFDNTDTSETGVEFLPILLKERISDKFYARDPEMNKEIVKGDQFSGIDNASLNTLVDYTFDEVDIYDNMILVSGKNFVSPFSGNALTTYKYFLADSADIDGLWCYKLEFTAKRKQDLAFSGHAWIHDGTFAIKDIELYILESTNLNFINDFGLQQTFSRADGKNWFKTKEYLFTNLNLSKDKEKQSFLVRRTLTREDVTINEPIKSHVFSGEKITFVDGANEQNKKFWETGRHEDLSDKEKAVYATIDSVKSTRAYKTISWLTYLGTTAYLRAGPVEFGRIYKFFSWNEIEGRRYRFGGRTSYSFSKKVQFDAYAAYGDKDKTWKYHGGVALNLGSHRTRWNLLRAYYRDDMAQLNQEDPLITHDNLVLSIVRFKNPLIYLMKIREATIFYEREIIDDLTLTPGFTHRTFYTVPNGIEFSTSDGINDSIPVNDFTSTELRLEAQWGLGQKWFESHFGRLPLTYNKPVVKLNYTAGIKGLLGGDYNYHKLELHIRHNLANPMGVTKYQLFAGKVFGDAPYPLLRMHQGNESTVYSNFAFNAMNEFEYVSDQYAAIWVSHHFGGLIMNRIPLIKKLKLRSLIVYKALVGNMRPSNEEIINLGSNLTPLNDYYMEAGFGIENIFKVLRVEMLWRLTQRNDPNSMKWGIRIGLSPSL